MIEVKQVVLLPGAKPHVKDLKVFVGMNRPELQPGELFMNDPVCGVYVPPKKSEYMDYFKIDKSFTVKGKFKESPLNHLVLFLVKGKIAARIEVGVMKNGQISTTAQILISGKNDPQYRIFDVGDPIASTGALAEKKRANDMDENNWVGFWVKTEHFNKSVLQISVGKEDSADPILVANLTGWGGKAPTHASFSYGQEPVKYTELRGEDASIEPTSCSGEI